MKKIILSIFLLLLFGVVFMSHVFSHTPHRMNGRHDFRTVKLNSIKWSVPVHMNGREEHRMDFSAYVSNSFLADTSAETTVNRQYILPWLTKNRKYKLYDTKKSVFVSASEYDGMGVVNPNLFLVCRAGKKGLIDSTGNLLLPLSYDELYKVWPNRLVITRNGKSGLVDNMGEFIINMEYSQLNVTSEGWYIVGNETGGKLLYGLIDPSGQLRIPLKYTTLQHLATSVYAAGNNQMTGLVNEDGKSILSPRYQDISNGYRGQYIIQSNGKYGVMRANGTLPIKPLYQYLSKHDSDDGPGAGVRSVPAYISIMPDLTSQLMDTTGTVLLKIRGEITYIGYSLFKIAQYGSVRSDTAQVLYQIYDAFKRKYLNTRKYTKVGLCREGKLLVTESGRSGYIDTSGRAITRFVFSESVRLYNPKAIEGDIGDFHHEYDDIDESETGNCALYGYTNSNLEGDARPRMGNADEFFDGRAVTLMDDAAVAINASGQIRVLGKYIGITPFFRGIAQAMLEQPAGSPDEEFISVLIDTTGKEIARNVSIEFDYPRIGKVILRKWDGPNLSKYALFDYRSKTSQFLGGGYSVLRMDDGYYVAQYKDVEVYIDMDGQRLMDQGVDFSIYEARELLQEGSQKLADNKLEEAIERYKKALQLRPGYLAAMVDLADCYERQDALTDALEWYGKALQVSGSDPGILYLRSNMLYIKKRYDEAYADLKILTSVEPDNHQHWFRKGFIESDRNDISSAIASYSKVIALNPEESSAYNNRANLYRKQKQNALALMDYNQALKRPNTLEDETKARFYANRAFLLIDMNRKSEACSDLLKAKGYGHESAAKLWNIHCR